MWEVLAGLWTAVWSYRWRTAGTVALLINEVESRAHSRMVDGLLNYETVTTYARQGFERQRHAQIQDQWIEASVASQKTLSALHIGQSAIIAGGVATVMLLAGQYTLEGEMSVGDLVLVKAYLIQICLPLNTLGFVFRQALDALVDTERLFSLLYRQPEIADRPGARPLALHGVVAQDTALFNDTITYNIGYGRQGPARPRSSRRPRRRSCMNSSFRCRSSSTPWSVNAG